MSESVGADIIRDFVSRLPGKPGVYRMYDAKGDVIYVGKARHLKNRVSNYTRMGGHTNRIAAMIALTVNMEFVTTRTEAGTPPIRTNSAMAEGTVVIRVTLWRSGNSGKCRALRARMTAPPTLRVRNNS